MRSLTLVLAIAAFGTFLVATSPTANAAAYCVQGVANSYPHDDCDGIACVGYNQNGWQYCVPSICQFQTDCCYYAPDGNAFYCP